MSEQIDSNSKAKKSAARLAYWAFGVSLLPWLVTVPGFQSQVSQSGLGSLPLLGVPVGLGLGITSLSRKVRGPGSGRGFAIAAIVSSTLFAALAVIAIVLLFAFIGAIGGQLTGFFDYLSTNVH